jgi:hypothetical protein
MTAADLDEFALWLAADWERKAAAAALSDALPAEGGKRPGAAFDWLRS